VRVFARFLLLITLLPLPSLAYGPLGHEIVGEIADRKLAGTATVGKIGALLDGMTLRRAATIPDEIKAWDKKGADDLSAFPHYPKTPRIEQQLREFWKANPPSPGANEITPSHHWFHYTDVPVLDPEKYSAGKTGRGQWDIVHVIPYCVGVLRGEIPEENARKITRPIAVILLAHLVGDIHQPLHVGAEYFSQTGQPVDPDRGTPALADEGGNTLSLVQSATSHRPRHYYHSFHAFWDVDAVRNLVIATPDELPKEKRAVIYEPARQKLLADLSASEAQNWRTAGDPKTWAEKWADEILPIAREAHARVRFEHVHPEERDGRVFAKGEARETGSGYLEWATAVVKTELHKAGWRLADLLEHVL
jgi:hypothetical protein